MIRPATPTDASAVAPLMFQAMEEIVYKMIGKEHREDAIALLQNLFEQEGNQYSYQNAWVYEENNTVIGSVIAYDGAHLHTLRAPVLALIRSSYGIDIVLEDETAEGELYIDTLSVLPTAQGRGIGSKLVRHLCEVSSQPLGLLVDVNNPEAERLYTRLGFEYANHQELAGGRYKHLILKLS
ncbi:N-acetyltransferase [Capnocytophaga ochracea]|jgi:acetyltransferase, GNAT family|uniref:GNAT family N-acetyltransferase n=1 Tax=Capnocytophaga TaxID=1016 RepID=UPI0006AE78A8|nr:MULTISPECIES: N-acetyltransferase [Capnocytophaga]ALC97322.1 GNAT family acetyltransferase [Capnocytophaga sp. oral taxon 323]MEB3015296.1 N-acetyltransferase [Capnocytophaga ochracea]MEB3035380.1 N-acetyltransferase [Capnocytophaga ochracea]